MNKRGFTLIEIIVCLVLIVGIGTISTVSIIKKDNKRLDDITKKIIDATNVYINVEKDDKGNYYSYGIDNGAKGVYVSVKTLEEKGYISKDIVKTLEDETKEDNNFVFVSNSIKESDAPECNNATPQEYKVSWDGTDTVYLCPYNEPETEEMSMLNLLLKNNKVRLNYPDLNNYKNEDAGVYIFPDKFGNSLYFYGKVTNNYLKFNNLIWRIIRINGDGTIRIVLEDNMDVFLEKANLEIKDGDYYCNGTGEYINIRNLTNNIQCISIINGNDLCFFDADGSRVSVSSIPLVAIDVLTDRKENSLYESNNYFDLIKIWFENNKYSESVELVKGEYFCKSGSYNKNPFLYLKRDFTCEENYFESEVGMISYKELKYTGEANSFLTQNSLSFHTADYEDGGSDGISHENYCWISGDSNITTCNTRYSYNTREQVSLTLFDEETNNEIFLGRYTYSHNNTIRGLRPVINLKSDMCFGGRGTESEPYQVVECS